MSRQNRKWSEAQKLQIINEAGVNGQMETIRKYNVAHSLFLRWKRAFEGQGSAGLKPKYRVIDPEVRRLEQENERLKRIVAKQALEIEFKDELLKKSL